MIPHRTILHESTGQENRKDTWKENKLINKKIKRTDIADWNNSAHHLTQCLAHSMCSRNTNKMLFFDLPCTFHRTDPGVASIKNVGRADPVIVICLRSPEERGTWWAVSSSGSWMLKTVALSAPSNRRAILSSYVNLWTKQITQNTQREKSVTYCLTKKNCKNPNKVWCFLSLPLSPPSDTCAQKESFSFPCFCCPSSAFPCWSRWPSPPWETG